MRLLRVRIEGFRGVLQSFCTRDGDQILTRYLRTMVKRYAVKARVSEAERVTPHGLRHTFATDLLRETKNIRLVQKALGHSDVSTTMIYTHVFDEELEMALRRRETQASVRATG